jgi:cobalt/nickel transport system ATP-binding protein
VLAWDEPPSDLAAAHAPRVELLLGALRRQGQYGLVLSTHDLDLAARIADRANVLKAGSVIADGTPRDLFYDAELLARAGLVEPRVVRLWREVCRRTGRPLEPRPVTEDEIAAALVGGG